MKDLGGYRMVREKKLRFLICLAALSVALSCGKKEETKTTTVQKPLSNLQTIKEGDRTVSLPNDVMSSYISKGDFVKIREEICGKDGCSGELETYKNEITFNTLVIFANVMVLFKKIDGALGTLCGVAGSQLGDICGSSAPILSQSPRIYPQQTNVIDTLLNLVGLKRDEITTLMEEVIKASENYVAKNDKNYVFRVTTPFNVKVGNLVDVWFKAGTELRYDLLVILGAVSQGVAALFNVINSHNWELGISGILSNASALLGDLQKDPPGLIRKLPETLGLDKAPNFLRFEAGKEELWKKIPGNISTLLKWASMGLDYHFSNQCKSNDDPALVCWNGQALRFNLDKTKKNIFLVKEAEGILALPAGFSDKTAQEVVKILGNGSEKFDCSKDNNWIYVVGGSDEFDISKIVNAAFSLALGSVTSVALPNLARIDFCMFFGVENAEPKSIRDLILPLELTKNENGYQVVNAGSLLAFEVEGTRLFYEKAITGGNTKDYPLYFAKATEDNFYVFSITGDVSFSSNTTEFWINPLGITVYIPDNPQRVTYAVANPNYPSFFMDFFMKNIFLFDPSTVVPQTQTLALIVRRIYIQGDYVTRGDWNSFIYLADKKLGRDYFEPLTTMLSLMEGRVYSKYPDDVFSLSGGFSEIIGQFGMKVIPYVLMKETSSDGKILNGALELDNCVLIWTFVNRVTEKYYPHNATDMYTIFALTVDPFLLERALGKNGLTLDDLDPNIKGKVGYLSDGSGICGLVEGGFVDHDGDFFTPSLPSGWNEKAKNWKFKAATNQILNDLIGIGLFALSAEQNL